MWTCFGLAVFNWEEKCYSTEHSMGNSSRFNMKMLPWTKPESLKKWFGVKELNLPAQRTDLNPTASQASWVPNLTNARVAEWEQSMWKAARKDCPEKHGKGLFFFKYKTVALEDIHFFSSEASY